MLDGRLTSAAKFVRQGAVFADVGCDHAHLPIFLLKTGKIERAYLSDINEGPLASARENVIDAGLLGRVEFLLSDGALALADKGVTDIAVCGMGGELIARIVEDSAWLKNPAVRLVLQPMTRVAHLRRTLAALGFKIIDESYSRADGKFYVCICAEYDGVTREISDAEAEIGAFYRDFDNDSLQIDYLKTKKRALVRTVEGRKLGGNDTSAELALIAAIDERVAALGG